MRPLKYLGLAATAAIAAGAVTAATAADFPRKPVTVVVGYGAGGGTDSYARALASVAPEYINRQPLIVVNKPGGSGIPAAKFVADSRPDGHTLYLASSGALYFSTQFRKAPVDPFKDFKIVCMVGRLLPAVFVHKDSPIQSAKELVTLAQKEPGKMRFATPGRTSTWGIAGLAFVSRNNIKAQDVPAKGGAPARGLVIGKQVDFGVFGIHLVNGFEDQVRPLGLLFPERDPNNKKVPTMKELGVNYTQVFTPMILMAPKKTPDAAVQSLDASCQKMTSHKAYGRLLKKAGLPAKYLNGPETEKYYKSLTAEWQPLVDELKSAKKKK
ncbi:MAG: tripartite tricarboxylate transporter substrate binding protein [Alphaproteobacteria bacterium]|nr:tripartite tricarboxylate transporter substrate binding protein [Alphaproteobacteria bacterium]